jgi:hypothetical protein
MASTDWWTTGSTGPAQATRHEVDARSEGGVQCGGMTLTHRRRPAVRHLGVVGTIGRVVGGTWLLIHAFQVGVGPVDALLGLVVFNAVVVAALALRGRSAPPLRFTGAVSHIINFAFWITMLNVVVAPSHLFGGSASLLAAARGYGGCEMFAVSNWLRRRDDQFGCAFYLPFDLVDQHLGHRDRDGC